MWMSLEDFDHLWNTQGLKYTMADFYLQIFPSPPAYPFKDYLDNAEILLRGFLVQGKHRISPYQQGGNAIRWWERLLRRKR